jgi:hypothetical protein
MTPERNETTTLPNGTGITTLPIELIQEIANHVPISSHISLKLVAKFLYLGLSSPPPGYLEIASNCEKRAVRRYVTERYQILGGRRMCVICDGLMPLEMYHGRTEPVCRWHFAWFERLHVVEEFQGTQHAEATIAPRLTATLCVHCKEVRDLALDRCACKSEDGCESCGRWEVECSIKFVH